MKTTTNTNRPACWALFLVILLLPMAALAGGTAVIATGGNNMQLAWLDNGNLHIQLGDDGPSMIVNDGNLYTLVNIGGQTRVVDMGGMLKTFRSKAKENMPMPLASLENIEATGETATVAGIEGRVYKVTKTNSDGEDTVQKLVLTDNPLVVSMTNAYMNSFVGAMAPDVAGSLQARLPGKDKGLLKIGDGSFELKSISDEEPDAAMFELPDKSQSKQNMMQKMMQQMMQQQQ